MMRLTVGPLMYQLIEDGVHEIIEMFYSPLNPVYLLDLVDLIDCFGCSPVG
jgi:hypothetical protein